MYFDHDISGDCGVNCMIFRVGYLKEMKKYIKAICIVIYAYPNFLQGVVHHGPLHSFFWGV